MSGADGLGRARLLTINFDNEHCVNSTPSRSAISNRVVEDTSLRKRLFSDIFVIKNNARNCVVGVS